MCIHIFLRINENLYPFLVIHNYILIFNIQLNDIVKSFIYMRKIIVMQNLDILMKPKIPVKKSLKLSNVINEIFYYTYMTLN